MLTQNADPQVGMCEHTGLVHVLTEMYARLGVKGAKPMSECGQGIPGYAGGQNNSKVESKLWARQLPEYRSERIFVSDPVEFEVLMCGGFCMKYLAAIFPGN